jgi:hypothetical protein
MTSCRGGGRLIGAFRWTGISLLVLQVGSYHHLDQLLEVNCRTPAELGAGLGSVANQDSDIGRPEETLVLHNVGLPVIYSDMVEGNLEKVTNRMALSGCDDVVIGFFLLKHEPHRLNVITSETPVPGYIHVAYGQNLLAS